MLKTDYTIEWYNPYEATLTFDGDSADAWFTVFVDGVRAFSFEDSGTITKTIQVSEEETHSIAIVQHDTETDDVASPEDVRLLSPTVRWLAITNASFYQVFEVDDFGDEYLLYELPIEDDDDTEVFSWEVPSNSLIEQQAVIRIRVYATGSFGTSETPAVVIGEMIGHAPRASTITPQESSTGIELLISKAS